MCLFTVRELRRWNIACGCFISPQPRLHALCTSSSCFLNHLSFPSVLSYLSSLLQLCLSGSNLSFLSLVFLFIPPPLILLTSHPLPTCCLWESLPLSFTILISLFFLIHLFHLLRLSWQMREQVSAVCSASSLPVRRCGSQWKRQRCHNGPAPWKTRQKNMALRRCTGDRSLHWGVLWNEGDAALGGSRERKATQTVFFREKAKRWKLRTPFLRSASRQRFPLASIPGCRTWEADASHLQLHVWVRNALVVWIGYIQSIRRRLCIKP